jgi:HAD superfamily hydrolase (TIGR01509 family)
MITTLLWDLSEVLIAGLVGVEYTLAPQINQPPQAILDGLGHEPLRQLCCNEINVAEYYCMVINQNDWHIPAAQLDTAIKDHFHTTIPGGIALMKQLSEKYQCILVSDHGKEWTQYIRSAHRFFHHFEHCFFSWQLGTVKRDPLFFSTILSRCNLHPQNCLLIDDSEKNIATANNLRIQGVRFASVADAADRLRAILVS